MKNTQKLQLKKPERAQVVTFVKDFFVCLLGTLIYAVSINYFVEPMDFVPGGVTTLAIIVHHFVPFIGIGAFVFLMNIPLFLLAFRKLGVWFVLKTAGVAGLLALSIDLVDYLFSKFHLRYSGDEKILAAIFGGIICGVGIGLVFTRGVTTGGTDIIVRLLKLRFPHLSVGKLVLIVDFTVILLAGLVYRSVETILFSLVVVLLDSFGVDYVLKGRSDSKMLLIVTDHYEEVKTDIIGQCDRGVTILDATGGYTGEPKKMLLTVVRAPEVIRVRRIVAKYDERPFIIISDSSEVLGEGFKSHKDTM